MADAPRRSSSPWGFRCSGEGFGGYSAEAECDLVLLEHARAALDHPRLTELPLPLAGHVGVEVPPADLAVLELARPGHLDPLLDALVGFVLAGHDSYSVRGSG